MAIYPKLLADVVERIGRPATVTEVVDPSPRLRLIRFASPALGLSVVTAREPPGAASEAWLDGPAGLAAIDGLDDTPVYWTDHDRRRVR